MPASPPLGSGSPPLGASVASSITAARLQRAQERGLGLLQNVPPPSERITTAPCSSASTAGEPPAPSGSGVVLNGHASYTYSNGDVYEGEWCNDLREGRGKTMYASGAVYEGQFSADKKHGHGMYSHASGDSYSGEWSQGKYHGRGVYTTATGELMVARYEGGAPIGEGVMISSDSQLAVRIENGTAIEEISLIVARRIMNEGLGMSSSELPEQLR